VDAAAERALAELVRAVVSRDLDELHARVARLERELAAPRSFARAELDRQRRAAVLHARRQGLSIAMRLALGRLVRPPPALSAEPNVGSASSARASSVHRTE
jgi:hypothetical protein